MYNALREVPSRTWRTVNGSLAKMVDLAGCSTYNKLALIFRKAGR